MGGSDPEILIRDPCPIWAFLVHLLDSDTDRHIRRVVRRIRRSSSNPASAHSGLAHRLLCTILLPTGPGCSRFVLVPGSCSVGFAGSWFCSSSGPGPRPVDPVTHWPMASILRHRTWS